jgi:small-conductance mechanosensitive channel
MQENPVFKKVKPRKLLPLLLIAVLVFVAFKTNIINEAIQTHLVSALRDQFGDLVTLSVNVVVGLVFISLMYLIYDPLHHGIEVAMSEYGVRKDAITLTMKVGNLLFWTITIFVGVSFIAPNFLSKLFLGFTFIGAALVLALQNFANNFVAGLMLTFSPKFQIGDKIDLIGVDADGVVLSVGYLSTKVRADDGSEISIANRDLWEKPVKAIDPASIKAPEPKEPAKDEADKTDKDPDDRALIRAVRLLLLSNGSGHRHHRRFPRPSTRKGKPR